MGVQYPRLTHKVARGLRLIASLATAELSRDQLSAAPRYSIEQARDMYSAITYCASLSRFFDTLKAARKKRT